ncbi:MAG: hypothetical protein K4571_10330 [Deltaproteobacteria bacterium]
MKYNLIRGTKILGIITHDVDDFPWHRGTFQATEDFEDVKQLFEEELELIELNDLNSDKWDNIWSEIKKPGLHLVALEQNKVINTFLIHINGKEAWWR